MKDRKFKLIIKLPMIKKVTTNQIYAGKHWTVRYSTKELYRAIFKKYAARSLKNKPKKFPVKLLFVFEFKAKKLDASNCSFMGKMAEDALIKNKVIPGDSRKYVASVEYAVEDKKFTMDSISIFYKPIGRK